MPEQPNIGSDVVANPRHAGLYREDFDRAVETGECIFCSIPFRERVLNLVRGGSDPGRDWCLYLNGKPALDRGGQPPAFWLLIVSRTHDDDTKPLEGQDWVAIISLVEGFKKEHGITGGCYFLRDGQPEVCGRVVRHPCVHYVVPRIGEDGKPIPHDLPVG